VTPRVVTSITAKRNVPLAGRSYGHWWLELGEDESYGWWPSRLPLRFRDALRGVPGVLNGVGVTDEGTPTRDPNHGLPADYEFHPVLLVPKWEDDLREEIRTVAQTFAGEWRWSTQPTMNCRLFQLALFDAVGLVDGTGNYFTRGSGCPALTPVRRFAGRVTGARRWPRNLPRPDDRMLVDAVALAASPGSARTTSAAPLDELASVSRARLYPVDADLGTEARSCAPTFARGNAQLDASDPRDPER
jgi:hypothetical protein